METRDAAKKSGRVICTSCGHVSKPTSMVKGVALGLGLMLLIPLVVYGSAAVFGPEIIVNNWLFYAMMAIVLFGLALRPIFGAFSPAGLCRVCGEGALVPIESDEARRIAAERQAIEDADPMAH